MSFFLLCAHTDLMSASRITILMHSNKRWPEQEKHLETSANAWEEFSDREKGLPTIALLSCHRTAYFTVYLTPGLHLSGL